jgi:hypothetical protein
MPVMPQQDEDSETERQSQPMSASCPKSKRDLNDVVDRTFVEYFQAKKARTAGTPGHNTSHNQRSEALKMFLPSKRCDQTIPRPLFTRLWVHFGAPLFAGWLPRTPSLPGTTLCRGWSVLWNLPGHTDARFEHATCCCKICPANSHRRTEEMALVMTFLSFSNHPTPLTWLRVTFGCSPS